MNGGFKFNNSSACKFALDRFYAHSGVGPLSFLNDLFNGKDSLYKKYQEQWNKAVSLAPSGAVRQDVYADNSEWYLMLYSFAGSRHIKSFPNSYYDILRLKDDPTTLVYDVDNRYEMETLKYAAVLHRRVSSSVQATTAVEAAIKAWTDFYREFLATLPQIQQAQALRPVIYRSMLMRIWYLAGMPQGITLSPANAFHQGRDGKTTTGDFLEKSCSFFDGANGEEFYFASDDCIKGIKSQLRIEGLKTDSYQAVVDAWDEFSKQWSQSMFFSDSIDDAVGEHPRSNLGLALLSLYKIYGFGDYFLLRECVSSRDPDICEYEAQKTYTSYAQERDNRLNAISAVSADDAKVLKDLDILWQKYYDALDNYVQELVAKGKIPHWRASFVKGMASIVQTNALLTIPYDREELPDESLDSGDD